MCKYGVSATRLVGKIVRIMWQDGELENGRIQSGTVQNRI